MNTDTTATTVAPSSLDVFIDASSLNQKETRAIKINQKQLEDKLLNGLIVAEFGTKMDAGWLGRTVVLVGEDDSKFHAKTSERAAFIKQHSHGKTMQRIIDLANSKTTVRDGAHLEALCGIKKRSIGGDFRHDDPTLDLGGDLKFYEMGSDICLAGSVDLDKIKEQGETLIIARHPVAEPNRIVLGQVISLWQIDGAWEQVSELIEDYKEWTENGREGKFKASNDVARIAIHTGSRDRLHIRNTFIRRHATEFYRDLLFREKRGIESWIERLGQTSVDFKAPTTKTPVPVTTISLGTIIEWLTNGTFAIPLYQRDIVTGKEFLLKFVTTTIFTDNQEHRGIFMFHTPSPNGKVFIVDGQQRIMNAINGFFVEGKTALEDCEIVFKGSPLNLSNRTWTEILDMAKVNTRVKKFVDEVLARKFSVRSYDHSYTVADMSNEYRIANSGAAMNRQQLRASLGSPIGNIVRYFTGSASFRSKIAADIDMAPIVKEIADNLTLHDRTILRLDARGAKLLHFGGIKTAEMELDKFVSICFHRCTSWGPGYSESENDLDRLYNESAKQTTAEVMKVWNAKLETFFDLLETAYTMFEANPRRYRDARKSHYGIDYGVRGHRIFCRKEEWDLFMFLVLELQRRYKGKTISITGDVVSWIFKQHVQMSVSAVSSGSTDTWETSYGGEIRKGTRDWSNIQSVWFDNVWNKLLLDLSVEELAKIGFKIE